jgi:hypothetical protein
VNDRQEVERDLAKYRDLMSYRDERVRAALAAGLTKMEIHQMSGLSRATIDRILDKEPDASGSQAAEA